MANQPSASATPSTDEDGGVTFAYTPAKLRIFEERIVVARKCGYDAVSFDGIRIKLAYAQATITAVRQKFYAIYGKGFIDWVAGPAPEFSRTADLAALEKLIPQESLTFIAATHAA